MLEAVRRIGHSPEDAILDLVDNSVQNHATIVGVVLSGQKSFEQIEIADDGSGMDELRLEEALRLGSLVEYPPDSLSKYGLGMKAAALSQGRRLTVLTRADGHSLLKAELDLEIIAARDDYVVRFLQPTTEEAETFEARTGGVGTLIRVDGIYPDSAKGLAATLNRVRYAVAETYHRFMTANDPVHFLVNGKEVEAFDPLFVGDPAVTALLEPKKLDFVDATGHKVVISVRANQLPHPPSQLDRRQTKERYDIKQKNIGVYVYRANRLIRRAETLGLFTPETKLLAFRASIDFSPDADEFFSSDVAKRRIVLADAVRTKLEDLLRPALHQSRDLWKSAKRVEPGQSEPTPHKAANSQINSKDSLLSTGRKEKLSPKDKAAKASKKIPRLSAEHRDKIRIIEVPELPDGLLWQPVLDKNGQVCVRINMGHPFHDKIYKSYKDEDPDLVEAVDYLLWALAHAEYNIGYDEDGKIEMMEELRRFASANLRRLLFE
ncbi:MAG: ATP-binding protein [Phycisphaerales bacterium]|nr:ATP-binding protein [Phycisphaerales bacterium]